jgi:hypothetical protein
MTDSEAIAFLKEHESRCPTTSDREQWLKKKWDIQGKWMIKATDEKGHQWVVKFCVNHDGKVPESCKREQLISMLGRALGIPVVEAWVIPTNDELIRLVQPLYSQGRSQGIRDHAVLMPFLIGHTIDRVRQEAIAAVQACPELVSSTFAFMQWVGDNDRGLADVMLCDGKAVLIDNGLCGPGKNRSIPSYYPHAVSPKGIIRMCVEGKSSFVDFVLKEARIPTSSLSNPSVIEQIKGLSHEALKEFVIAAGVESWVADKLDARKATLHTDYQAWLASAAILP